MEKKKRVYSTVEDSDLLNIIDSEFKDNPNGFSSEPVKEGLVSTASFLRHTSARTIPQVSKWL